MNPTKEAIKQISKFTGNSIKELDKKSKEILQIFEDQRRYLTEYIPENVISFIPRHDQGWECPKCGRIYSPHYHICPTCNQRITEKEQANGDVC